MRIIESKTESKAPERLCEDLLVTTQDFIAVIDGVTPKSDFSYKGKSTGRLAAECVAQAVKRRKRRMTAAVSSGGVMKNSGILQIGGIPLR